MMRYQNPHQNFQNPQQPMQQPSQFPQQFPQQQPMQQMNQQPMFMQLPNGMIQTPMGIMTPQQFANWQAQMQQQQFQPQPMGVGFQQPGMMPNQQGQQYVPPQQPSQGGMMMNANNQRFNPTQQQVPQQPAPVQNQVLNPSCERFQGAAPTPPVVVSPVSVPVDETKTTPKRLVIEPKVRMVDNNTRVRFKVITSDVKESGLHIVDGGVIPAMENLSSAYGDLVEEAYNAEQPKLVTVGSYLITNVHHMVSVTQDVIDLLSRPVKQFVGSFRERFEAIETTRELYVYDQLNDLLTERINDFIAVRSPDYVSIDSFMQDYPDLIRHIRKNELEYEDVMQTYLATLLKDIAKAMESIPSENLKTLLASKREIVFIDKFAAETGLDQLDIIQTGQKFYQLIRTDPANTFLVSVLNQVYEQAGVTEFDLITIGCEETFRVIVNNDDPKDTNYFIRRMK